MSDASPRNRLAAEPSLYLRQHAGNPVDWYPWGAEALERARRENKPILLSIGYSACHWCHVMERESFENEAIARLMNEEYVCIKVDREERPDIDAVYMKTVQLMTGRGGWPMTLFLAPDLKPYYAGTYFPPEDRGGMPAFARVLAACARAYRDEGERVAENGARVLEALAKAGAADAAAVATSEDTFEEIADALGGVMDADHGGFGQAPKFPQSLCLSLLMAVERRRPSARRHELLTTTLDRMADGGIYDHLGGGFHRYSVDRYWLVPHFEKMLYDQALLADLYGEAWRVFGEDRYAETAGGILDYVYREMTSREGAFYSTQDADSEGMEGKFYVWTPAEIAEALGGKDKDVELVCRFFDVSEEGNFEGHSILRRTLDFEEAARMFGREAAEVEKVIAEAKLKLYQWRSQRVLPATDRKILTDWNGLMIGAMARTGRLLGRSDLVASAAAAADAVRGLLWRDRLLHLYGESEARVGAFLDDFAFLGRGCLELFLAAGRSEDLASARRAADELIERFEAPESGGFYLSASDAEAILVRSRDLYDGAVPAGNSVAIELLLRLYELTGHDPYRRAGEVALEAFLGGALANPYGGGHLLSVALGRQIGLTTVVIAAGSDAAAEKQLTRAALEAAGAETAVLVVADGVAQDLPEVARAKAARDGRATAYLCQGRACSAPILQAEELSRRLTSAAPMG